MDKKPNERELKKIFSVNSIITKVINFAAYIILIASVVILLYISFVVKFDVKIDWTTLGIFSAAVVMLVWLNWNNFYKQQYEKYMQEDIEQAGLNKYSIHSRYYMAIKDYTDAELQKQIDKFNQEFLNKWLSWVEKTVGLPIESGNQIELDRYGKPVLDGHGQPKIVYVVGIKDAKYRVFKNNYHKYLAWRIKHRKYPQSGYRTSMEIMSLLSFQDANLNKRNLKASKHFYAKKSISKFLSTLLIVSVTGSIIPEMIQGDIWSAVLKLLVAIGSLLGAVFMGSMNGVRGARLKLSTVEEVCMDLEKWADKKPILAPYQEPVKLTEEKQETQLSFLPEKDKTPDQVASSIFSNSNLRK